MFTIVCSECKQTFALSAQSMYGFASCAHTICINCIFARYPGVSEKNGKLIWDALKPEVKCSVCGVVNQVKEIYAMQSDVSDFEATINARKNIQKYMNCDRACFPNTPAFDDFCELREDYVDMLANAKDAQKLAEIERKLSVISMKYREQLLETEERSQKEDVEKIKRIVQIEENFYEIAKLSYQKGFRLPNERLEHPLKWEYSSYFTNNQAIEIEDLDSSDQPRSHDTAKLRNLLAKQPALIDSTRQIGQRKFRMIASGYNPKLVETRVMAEAFAYFAD